MVIAVTNDDDLCGKSPAAVFADSKLHRETEPPSKNEVLKVNFIKRVHMVAIGSCLSLMAVSLISGISGAMAQAPSNQKTTVTFSQPVQVPGVGAQTLPAGTYVFQLVDSRTDRNIVRILSPDGNHVYTTILAIPNYRLKPTSKTVITFRERPEGQPEAIRAWFYPGKQWGQEFVYPKTAALALAKATGEPVLAMPLETNLTVANLESAPVVLVQSSGEEAPATAEVGTPADVEPTRTAAEVGTPTDVEPTQTADAQPPAARLPKTASDLPLLALSGLLLMGGWLALSAFMKRDA